MSHLAYMSAGQFLKALEDGPYAWPGGYPRYFVMSDGEAMSFQAADDAGQRILEAIADKEYDSGWMPIGVEVNWEDASLYCCHTGERIQSAYADEPEHEEGN